MKKNNKEKKECTESVETPLGSLKVNCKLLDKSLTEWTKERINKNK
ncbi:hypothetical protein [Thermohalobacter berrensis]|nr:hypothetical protein [Thermohalobacter berrensis]